MTDAMLRLGREGTGFLRDAWKSEKPWFVTTGLLVILLLLDPAQGRLSLDFVLTSLAETAPYLILSIAVAAYAGASGADNLIARIFSGSPRTMILIAAIFGLVRKGDLTQATEKLDRIYYDMLKEDAAFFRKIPKDDLTHKLLEEHNYTNGHLEILAELFNADGELEIAKGNRELSLDFSEKSLLLFEYIDIQEKTQIGRASCRERV